MGLKYGMSRPGLLVSIDVMPDLNATMQIHPMVTFLNSNFF